MEILKAVIISIIQGITEFLPISSSGHIILLKKILDFEIGSNLFDVVVHFGTLISVVIFFRNEIRELIIGLFKKEIKSTLFKTKIKRGDVLKLWLYMIIAIIPAGVVGLFLDDLLDDKFSNIGDVKYLILGILFLITGVIQLSTIFLNKKEKGRKLFSITIFQSILVGLFQALAVLPGISRSGSTISAGLLVGIEKKDAGRFSFLLSIPLILAAFLLKIIKILRNDNYSDNINALTLIIGLVVSGIVGYFSLKILFRILSKGKFWVFAIYMVIPAAVSFIIFFTA